jgi:hypothetical protein
LYAALPAGLTPVQETRAFMHFYNAGVGGWKVGLVQVANQLPRLNFMNVDQTTNLSASTNTTYIVGQITFEVP